MSKGQQPGHYRNVAYYRDCFSQIKVYKNQKQGGEALNQPILLLSVIDLIAQGSIKNNTIRISDELISTFKRYWSLLTFDSFENSDFALPFFHLKNRKGKFWHLKFSSDYEGGRPQTINTLKQAVDYAYLDDELFSLLQEQETRKELIDALIAAWFSSKGKAIEDILKINQEFQDSTQEETEKTKKLENPENEPKFYLKKSIIRNAFFRKAIVHIYDYKCAFCRLKVTRKLTQNIVDGAHIKPFFKFYDSKIDNGIAFCKNHHWAFDQGWFCIDDKYKILVASDLEEESPHAKPMKDFHGEIIVLPNSEQYFPSMEALQWHRENIFRAS
jgi:putative restriction endonuclease